jgi:NTP pyrophosphatase (non-canonical NTP hydrolase)
LCASWITLALSATVAILSKTNKPSIGVTTASEEAELADLLIRAFHYAGKRGIDLGRAVQLKHAYNINRPYKHGKVI